MLPHEESLLTDQQLRDASIDQIEDLVHRVNSALQRRGVTGLVWRRGPEPTDLEPTDPADPAEV